MSENAHASIGMRVMYIVWGWLLVLTAVEVVLAYLQVPVLIMLVALLGLSIVKSVLIVAYFMHLKFEKLTLVLTIIPALVACILLMTIIFPDSIRVRDRGVFRDLPPPTPTGAAPSNQGHE